MTERPAHRALIQAAIEDAWLNADPAQPIPAAGTAELVETYLAGHGYLITHDPYRSPMPPRASLASLAFTAFLVLSCLTAATVAVINRDWGWAVLGTLGIAVLAHEEAMNLADRRRYHRHFQLPRDHS